MSHQTLEIKRAIGTLCKHINTLYHLDLKPEHFRLAKHNKVDEEVVEKMWRLLNILTINDVTPVIGDIKAYMTSVSYNSLPFYDLPEDMSAGSRELLIAVGYVLQKGLSRTLEGILRNSAFSSEFNILENFSPHSTKLTTNHIKTRTDYLHYKEWIKGKIQNNIKLATEYQMCNSKLLERLQEDLRVNVDSLNVFEILALNSEKYAALFLRNSESVVEILENHENWLRKASIFWRWMGTVVEERRKRLK